MPKYTEGICCDGAAILKDGEMITIEQILKELNGAAEEIDKLGAENKALEIFMPRRLTAENGGKALMIGEFFETISQSCHYEVCVPEDRPICGGTGFIQIKVPISWSTIKEIYAKAADHFGEAKS